MSHVALPEPEGDSPSPTETPPPHASRNGLRGVIGRLFEIDPRSLALFRILFGLVILVDLTIRSSSLTEHYSEHGVLPHSLWLQYYGDGATWTLHNLNGGATPPTLLFVLAAVAAVGLIVGYRTRTMTIVSWLLLTSLHARNPLVSNAGDDLMRMMLFWAMWLPLGARWSIDALQRSSSLDEGRTPPSARPIRSLATAVILLQLCGMYWATGLMKMNESWLSGLAMHLVAGKEMYARPAMELLAGRDGLLHLLSVSTPWFELILPLLCFVPRATAWFRLAAMALALVFHTSIELTLCTGIFQFVAVASWSLFLPASLWDRLSRASRGPGPWIGGLSRWTTSLLPAAGTAPIWRPARWIGSLLLLTSCTWVVAWNTHAVREQKELSSGNPSGPFPGDALARALRINARWNMFSSPSKLSGYYVVVGTLAETQTTIDLLDGGAPFVADRSTRPEDTRPPRPSEQYPDHRWRKYLSLVSANGRDDMRRPLGRVLAAKWNRLHPDQEIDRLEINFMQERFKGIGKATVWSRRVLFRGPILGTSAPAPKTTPAPKKGRGGRTQAGDDQ